MLIDAINQAADNWFLFMTHATWQATVTALFVLAIVWREQRIPANVRYLLLLVALAKFLAPPFVASPIGIYSQVCLADATDPHAAPSVEPRRDAKTASTVGRRRVPGSEAAVAPSMVDFAEVEEHRSQTGDGSTDSTAIATHTPLPRSLAYPQMSWQSWLMMAFALGASLSISWIAIGIYQLRRIVRRSEIASDEGRREFRRLARDMGIRRPVRLLLSPDPITPMASGLFRATVIVPKSMMQQLSFPDRQAILGHELAHHRRFDPAMLWVQGVFLTMWWFHPLAWLLHRALLRVREECCDDLVVIENVVTREAYCSALVRVVEWCAIRRRILGFAAEMGPLENRIARVMDPQVTRSAAVSRYGWAIVIAICLVILPGLEVQSSSAITDNPEVTDSKEEQAAEPNSEAPWKPGDIGGRVLDSDGGPVQATVWMRRQKNGRTLFESTTTFRDGHFRFSNVEAGYLTFTATADGYSFSGTHYSVQEGQFDQSLELVLTPPTTMALEIRDEKGEPIAGAELARVSWTLPDKSRYWLPLEVLDLSKLGRPKSNADGVLLIPGIPLRAKCDVVVKHEGFVSGIVEKAVVANHPTSLTLEAGVPIVIRAIDAPTDEPALDATVTIDASQESISVYGEPVDEAGEFHTRFPVAPRRITIHVNHPELATTKWVSLSGGTGSGDFEFKFYRRGTVRGRVVNLESADPCEGVPVRVVSDRQAIATARSERDGYFEISAPAGRFTLSVGTGNGFYPPLRSVPLTLGNQSALHIRLASSR